MAGNILYIDEETHRSLEEHLFQGESEQVAFLYARHKEKEGETAFCVEDTYQVPEEELEYSSRYFISLTDEAFATAIKKAFESGLIPIEVHSHRDSSHAPGFSESDFEGFEDTVQHVRWRLQGRPYVAVVLAPSGFDALVWKDEQDDPEGLDAMVVADQVYHPSGRSLGRVGAPVDERRYDRQLPLFGKKGQEKLGAAEVAIVGLGGLGSHVAQQLAYLGIRRYQLVDGDKVEQTNLNRLVGATPEDAKKARYKVEVAREMIKSIAPDASVETYAGYFVTEEGFDRIRSADVIIGAVDNDASRHILNQLAQAYSIPYMDLASDIDAEHGHFGGRVFFSIGGELCLNCKGLLNHGAIDSLLATREERKEKAEIYGVPEEELGDETGPAVVSINGTIASLAVTELLMHLAGYRSPQTYFEYDGRKGRYGGIRTDSSTPDQECLYCDGIYGKETEAGVEEQHLHNGDGERLRTRLEAA